MRPNKFITATLSGTFQLVTLCVVSVYFVYQFTAVHQMSPHDYIADEHQEVDEVDSYTHNTDVMKHSDEDVGQIDGAHVSYD